jgi:hypothetical protein
MRPDEGDRRYAMEAEAAGDNADEDGIARSGLSWQANNNPAI